jgi:hypothetical protein
LRLTEREVTILLADFATVLSPLESTLTNAASQAPCPLAA